MTCQISGLTNFKTVKNLTLMLKMQIIGIIVHYKPLTLTQSLQTKKRLFLYTHRILLSKWPLYLLCLQASDLYPLWWTDFPAAPIKQIQISIITASICIVHIVHQSSQILHTGPEYRAKDILFQHRNQGRTHSSALTVNTTLFLISPLGKAIFTNP